MVSCAGPMLRQDLKTWSPLCFDQRLPIFAALGFFLAICVTTMNSLAAHDLTVLRLEIPYAADPACAEASGAVCAVHFTPAVTMPYFNAINQPGLFMYYRLTEFHQNHRSYDRSRSAAQLRGETPSDAKLASDCGGAPLAHVNPANGKVYNPCGLAARTFFSDKFVLTKKYDPVPAGAAANWTLASMDFASIDPTEKVDVSRTGIAFRNATGVGMQFTNRECDSEKEDCWLPRATGLCPLNAAQPCDVTSTSVENEDFANWMKPAAFNDFSKLYAILQEDLIAGTEYTLWVKNDWWVKPSEYGGNRSVIITTIDPNLGGFKGENAAWACSVLVGWTGLCFLLALAPRGSAHYGSREEMETKEEVDEDEASQSAAAYVASTHGPVTALPAEGGKKKKKKKNSDNEI